jgi:predicted lipid-binding transport protein (Tim44 family)
MKSLIAIFAAAVMVGGLYAPSADAARIGGGRSVGIQRSVTPPPARPASAPTQQAAPQQAAPAAAAAPAAQGNRWLGPLAGIAAGLGLAWLFSQGGFSAMGGVVLAVLGALVLFALLRMYSRQKAMAAGGGAMQFSNLGGSAGPTEPRWGAMNAAPATPSAPVLARVPAGFDVAGFEKQAKMNFLRLQAANDRGDLAMIQDICVDELAKTLGEDIRARQGATQHTDILGLEATLIEVVTEGPDHFASISFSGSSIEEPGAAPKPFQEIWHLHKPVSGDAGWLLAGIQAVS